MYSEITRIAGSKIASKQSQRIRKCYDKTLGTSVMDSSITPQPPPLPYSSLQKSRQWYNSLKSIFPLKLLLHMS